MPNLKTLHEKPWHRLPVSEMGDAVQRIIEGYKKEQAGRRSAYSRNLELYEQMHLSGYSAHSYYGANTEKLMSFERDRLGIVRSAIDSAVANIFAPQKPKPQWQTLGATWEVRRRAYKLDRVCEGILNQRQEPFCNMWAFMIDTMYDTATQGAVAIKVMSDRVRKRIVHRNIPTPDIFVDPSAGRLPQDWFQVEPCDLSVAQELFPKHAQKLEGAKDYEWFGSARQSSIRASREIELGYAWRLPTGPDKPGKWCVVANGTVLDSGDWVAPAPPFVFGYWQRHRAGIWGSGLAFLMGAQAQKAGELDERLTIREEIASGKYIWYRPGSINPDSLAMNDPKMAVPVEDGKEYPQESLSLPFAPMELDFRNVKVRDTWDSVGISQVSAAARREPGIESGVAQMTLNDTKDGRHLPEAQRYEQMYVDFAHQWVWRLRELAANDPDMVVQYPNGSLLREVKWADVDVEDEKAAVTVAPASSLPHDPWGRQQMVQALREGNIISQATAKTLIGWPDLDSELQTDNAETQYIDALIELYTNAEEASWDATQYQAPEGFITNKLGALTRFGSAWFRIKTDQISLPPEEKAKAEFCCGLLVRYIQELSALLPPVEPLKGGATAPDMLAQTAPQVAAAGAGGM